MGITDYLTCLLRNLYAGQEATVRTGHGTTDWFQIGKGVHQGCILSPCLFKLYAEYIMRNAGLEEAQAGIKIAGRNTNNLRYADDTSMPRHLFEDSVDEGTTRRGTATPVHRPQRPAGSTHSSTRGLRPPEQLERQAEFHSSTQDEA